MDDVTRPSAPTPAHPARTYTEDAQPYAIAETRNDRKPGDDEEEDDNENDGDEG